MSVSALFVLDLKGRVLLSRDYRGDVSLKVAEKFIIRLNELEEAGKARPCWSTSACKHGSRGSRAAKAAPSRVPIAAARSQVTPVFFDDGVSYAYITHSNLVLMTVSRTNANAAATLLFLHKLRDILTTYFGELEEESLRDNFVIAYELLDEASPLSLRQAQLPLVVLARQRTAREAELQSLRLQDCDAVLLPGGAGDGLWVGAVHRGQDIGRVHKDRRLQNGGTACTKRELCSCLLCPPGCLHMHRRALLDACMKGVSAPQVQARPPMAVTNAVSWRSEGIRYKKNEVRIMLQSRHCGAV